MKNTAILIGLLSIAATSARAQGGPADDPRKATFPESEVKVRAEITFSPVLAIELGPGAKVKKGETDVVNFKFKSPQDYHKGIKKPVEKQLHVYSIATPHTVSATISSTAPKEKTEELYKIFQLGIGPAGSAITPKKASASMENLFTGNLDRTGGYFLDTFYEIVPLKPENVQSYLSLTGKDKTVSKYSITITYTVAPI